jgi:hypothetical protein
MTNEIAEQIAFQDLLKEMEERHLAELTAHRELVERWWDSLPEAHKRTFGAWVQHKEWLTFQALAAAAGSWYADNSNGVRR